MIVTLCGSIRFERHFREAGIELGKRGIGCFTLAAMPGELVVSSRGQSFETDTFEKVIFDLSYHEKIMRSDAVLVVGTGYIGRSTAREVLWARMLEKAVISQYDSQRMVTPTTDPVEHELRDWCIIADKLWSRTNDQLVVFEAEKVLRS